VKALKIISILVLALNSAASFSRTTADPGKNGSRDRTAIMIPGLYNETHPDQMKTLRELLQQNEHIFKVIKLSPNSARTISENADLLNVALRTLYTENGNRPLLIFAHSKGGAEITYTLIKYPDLITSNIVDVAVLMNAALGTGFANATHITCQLPGIGLILRPCGRTYDVFGGIASLKYAAVRNNFNALIQYQTERFPNLKSLLRDKIFYIRSELASSSEIKGAKKYFYIAMKKVYGANDSLVAVDNQKLDDIGQTLGEVHNFEHGYLVDLDFNNPEISGIVNDLQIKTVVENALAEIGYATVPARTEIPVN
jgi:hypothetical protein